MVPEAVTFGRFNYLSMGHISFLESILKKWSKVTVIILDTELSHTRMFYTDSQLKTFYNMCESHFQNTLLPLDTRIKAFDNISMINTADVHVFAGLRPELHSNWFNMNFPATDYDLVFSKDPNNQFDKLRFECFKSILKRNVFEVKPSLYVHNTQILRSDDKESYFDPTVLRFYQEHKVTIGN